MIKKALTLMALGFSMLAHAGTASCGEWDAWRVSANTLIVADWAQTRYVAEHPDDYNEVNPILGEEPSTAEVNAYFLASLTATNLIGEYVMPKEHRQTWYGVVSVVQFTVVARNASLGVGFKF